MALGTFTATADSSLEGITTPNANYGSNSGMTLGVVYLGTVKSSLYRSILNFDLSSIAGGTVNSGTMVLVNKNGINTVAAQVTRCTRPSDWVENQVTWNKFSTAGGSWTTAGGDIDNTTPGTIAFTHSGTAGGTTTIGSMHTYGTDALANRGNIVSLILRLVDEAPGSGNKGGDIWTINGTGAFVPPQLVLNYDPPPIGTSTFLPRMNLLGIG